MWLSTGKKYYRTNLCNASNNGKCFDFNMEFHLLFVHFRQAFDNVRRMQLLHILESCGLPKEVVRLVHMALKDSKARILVWWEHKHDVSSKARRCSLNSAVNLALHKGMK